MTTIQLTDAQLAQFTACGLIVVDATECRVGEPACAICPAGCLPDELWRKLTEPCHRPPPTLAMELAGEAPCAKCDRDCAGGRQVITLTATCETYGDTHIGGNGQVRIVRGAARCVPDGTGTCESEPPCERGVVTLGRFTIRLLPIVEHFGKLANNDPCVCVGPTGVFLHGPRESPHRLTLDPLPQPGQWAVQLEAVA